MSLRPPGKRHAAMHGRQYLQELATCWAAVCHAKQPCRHAHQGCSQKGGCSPHEVPAEQVALQQVVINQCHKQQQRRKGAGQEGDKLGNMAENRHGELPDVLLRGPLAGQQPAAGTAVAYEYSCLPRSGSLESPGSREQLTKRRMPLESYEATTQAHATCATRAIPGSRDAVQARLEQH